MFIPGCYCCTPPTDPCTLSGCTWSATEGTDTEFTGDEAYNSPLGGATPDGTYEISSFQNPRLGNNLPCRQIWIDTVAGFSPTVNENVYAINWVDGATHNPAAQCPLANVAFCVESKRASDSDPSLTDGVVFVLRQSGKIYATTSQPVGVNWKRASGTYTSRDFTWINGAGSPDFTSTGGVIEFGFALRLSVFANTEPFDSVLFDNLCVKPKTACGSTCVCECNFQFEVNGISVSATGMTPVFPSDGLAFINNTLNSIIVNTGYDSLVSCSSRDEFEFIPSDHSYFNFVRVSYVLQVNRTTRNLKLIVLVEYGTPGTNQSKQINFDNGQVTSGCVSFVDPIYTTSTPNQPHLNFTLTSPTASVSCQ